jgi:hypothetical protein
MAKALGIDGWWLIIDFELLLVRSSRKKDNNRYFLMAIAMSCKAI